MMNQPACRVLVPRTVCSDITWPAEVVREFSGNCMGTSWQVSLVGCRETHLPAIRKAIACILENIEAQMSHFRTTSSLCQFAQLPSGQGMTLPAEFAYVMHAALDVAKASGGAFDPTLGQEIDAWGFGSRKKYTDCDFHLPLFRYRRMPGKWKRLSVDADGRMVQPGGITLNLSAIAKGFAVDAVAEYLQRLGLHHYLVEVGGELRGSGMKPEGQPWWVALEWPAPDCSLPVRRIALHGLSIATSGSYRRCFHASGRCYQHTFDPSTGAPVTHRLAFVSVIHEQCMLADAWASAIMVAGLVEGVKMAQRNRLAALLQWPDESGGWHEIASGAWKDLER